MLVVGRFSAKLGHKTPLERRGSSCSPKPSSLGRTYWRIKYFSFFVFGRFSAKLGPKTPLERRGSSCGAGCTKNQGAPEGLRRGPEGPRRGPPGPGGAPEPSGPRRGPGGALRFLDTSNSDFADFDGVVVHFVLIVTVFSHVEVGSSPKEPDVDLFARVGRRGG